MNAWLQLTEYVLPFEAHTVALSAPAPPQMTAESVAQGSAGGCGIWVKMPDGTQVSVLATGVRLLESGRTAVEVTPSLMTNVVLTAGGGSTTGGAGTTPSTLTATQEGTVRP